MMPYCSLRFSRSRKMLKSLFDFPAWYYDLIRIFSARIVLEVFGGGGAIWGFSEAIGLRTPLTVWFWRPAALTFGAIFFIRWIMQILDFVAEAKRNDDDLKTVGSSNSAVSERRPLVTGMEMEETKYGTEV